MMAEIQVHVETEAQAYACTVTVAEGGRTTTHRVTVDKTDYQRLTGGKVPPARLVEASFAFLLKREPKESILRSFNLMTIQRYFPEYESQIGDRL
jgi:hypothetical protein